MERCMSLPIHIVLRRDGSFPMCWLFLDEKEAKQWSEDIDHAEVFTREVELMEEDVQSLQTSFEHSWYPRGQSPREEATNDAFAEWLDDHATDIRQDLEASGRSLDPEDAEAEEAYAKWLRDNLTEPIRPDVPIDPRRERTT